MLKRFKKILLLSIIIIFAYALVSPYFKISYAYDSESCYKDETSDDQSKHLAEIEMRVDSINDPCLNSVKQDFYKILNNPTDFSRDNINKIIDNLSEKDECQPMQGIGTSELSLVSTRDIAYKVLAWIADYASCFKNRTFTDLIKSGFEKEIPEVITNQQSQIEITTYEPNSAEEGTCPLINNSHDYCDEHFISASWFYGGMGLVNGLTVGLYMAARGLLTWVLKIFQWLLYPNNFSGYINFLNPQPSSNNPSLVPQLWSFARNLANLGIIIGMIFMAIATILRIEKYSWKKMLPKLVLVALLVNFSLVITGIFVDISNYISISVINEFGNSNLATLVVNCGICPVVTTYFELSSRWSGTGVVRGAGMGLVLSFIFLFQFVGLLFYVLTRIVTIIICLITSPLAFFSFAIPGGEKIWDLWRTRFQQAIVILPILCLTLLISLKFIIIVATNLANNISKDHFLILLGYTGFIIVFAQLVRYVAKFLGVEQVEKGFQLAKKAVNTIAMAGVAAVGGIALGKALSSGAWKKTQEKLQKSTIQPLYGIGNWMDRQSDKFTRAKAKPAEEFLKTQTTESVRRYKERARARGDRIGVALALNELTARDQKLEEKDSEDVHFAKSVPFLNIKDMKKANPMVFAENFTEPERLSKLRAVIQSRHPGLSFQDADRLAIERLTLELAQKSSPENLKTGNWADILHHIETSGQNNLYNFLNNLVDSLRPEGLANVFQSMNEAQKRRYGNALIAATQQRLQTPHNTQADARNALLKTHNTPFWRAFLHNLVP